MDQNNKNNNNNNDNNNRNIPQGGSSSPMFLGRIEIRNVSFCRGRITGRLGENRCSKDGNQTRATVVGGERSHLYTIPTPRSPFPNPNELTAMLSSFWNDYLSVFEKRKPKLWPQLIGIKVNISISQWECKVIIDKML